MVRPRFRCRTDDSGEWVGLHRRHRPDATAMRGRRFLALAAGSLALAAQTPAPGRTAAGSTDNPPRIRQSVNDNVRLQAAGGVPALVRRSTDLGALPPEQAVRRLVLVLRRGPAQEGALRLLLREQLNRNSPQFHRWLSPSEFGEKFGVGDADTAVISRWLGAHGLKIDRLSQGRDVIEASGTAAEVAEAFATPLHRFRQNAEEFVANTQPPTLPAALAEVLAGPLSLNSIARKPAPEPLYNQGTGALQPHVLSPGD